MKNEISTLFYATDVSLFNDESKYNEAIKSLSKKEQDVVERYKKHDDRLLSLVSKLLLKKTFSDFGINPANIAISANKYGKPYIENVDGIFFNVSHSGKIAISAVSKFEVGCDVERITESKDKIARRYFTPTEYERLMRAESEEERNELFFRFWTLKESFVKAIGLGLNLSLADFSFDINGNEPIIYQNADNRVFRFKEFNGISGYKIALALNGNPNDIELKTVNVDF